MNGLSITFQNLPPADIGGPDTRAVFHDAANRDAWQRELERALSIAVPPSPGPSAPAVFLAGLGEVEEAQLRVTLPESLPAPPANRTEACGTTPEIHREAMHGAIPRLSSEASEAREEQVSFASRAADRREIEEPAADMHATARIAAQAGVQPARPPVRVHADWSADGVRIWLGMDATTATAVQSITSQLQRWLAGQGVRALSIACNGHVLVEEPITQHKERA